MLHMSKPTSFEYKSGQYVFVQCPAVSKFEWLVFFYFVRLHKPNSFSCKLRFLFLINHDYP